VAKSFDDFVEKGKLLILCIIYTIKYVTVFDLITVTMTDGCAFKATLLDELAVSQRL